jgi:hypothetical protein
MKNEDKNEIQNLNDPREPFEEPTLECEELFETLALACGKIQPVTFNCQRSNRLS